MDALWESPGYSDSCTLPRAEGQKGKGDRSEWASSERGEPDLIDLEINMSLSC